jgi:Arc/MetJ-type ribon-helix-helix transcriptional regulator
VSAGGYFVLEKIEGKKAYHGITLPFDLINRIDALISNGNLGYQSRAEFIREAVRTRLDQLEDKDRDLKRLKQELKGSF